MDEVRSSLRSVVIIGAIAGLSIAIVWYGLSFLIAGLFPHEKLLNASTLSSFAFTVLFALIGLLCGYIVAARATGDRSVQSVFRDVIIAGAVAGLFNWLGHGIFQYPELGRYWDYYVIDLVSRGIYDMIGIVVLSLAGAAIFAAVTRKPRQVSIDGWPLAAGVGMVAAFAVMLAYCAQMFIGIIVNAIFGNNISGSYSSLIDWFVFGQSLFLIGILAGLITAITLRRSQSSPATFVLSTGLAGLIAGALGSTMYCLVFIILTKVLFIPESIGDSGLYMLGEIFYGAVMLTFMAIGGGSIYTRLTGQPEIGPRGPAKNAAIA